MYRYFVVKITDQQVPIQAVCRVDTDELERFVTRCKRLSFIPDKRCLQRKLFDGKLYDCIVGDIAGVVYEVPSLQEIC